MVSIPQEVYQMILDNLHITYTPDDSTKNRITNEISSGIEYIRKYCDPSAECSPGTNSGQLLCDYVLRSESGALETFAADFAEEITAVKIETDVDGYAEAMGYVKENQ